VALLGKSFPLSTGGGFQIRLIQICYPFEELTALNIILTVVKFGMESASVINEKVWLGC
jgi:hypothetical protein